MGVAYVAVPQEATRFSTVGSVSLLFVNALLEETFSPKVNRSNFAVPIKQIDGFGYISWQDSNRLADEIFGFLGWSSSIVSYNNVEVQADISKVKVVVNTDLQDAYGNTHEGAMGQRNCHQTQHISSIETT